MKILITGGSGNISTIIKNNILEYDIIAPSKNEMNLLDITSIDNFLQKYDRIDVVIHTAIQGGRRTKVETSDVVYNNLLMFENLLKYIHKFKYIINLDSGAIYDRATDIYNKKENELYNIPKDYYGFSKYIIYNRSKEYDNIYNFRIFNIFHPNEENDRFIKKCIHSLFDKSSIIINNDKYFDFVYYIDFIKILKYYLNNFKNENINTLPKTINISYNSKYKLSEIAKKINPNAKIIIENNISYNYTGDPTLLNSLNLDLIGLDNSIIDCIQNISKQFYSN